MRKIDLIVVHCAATPDGREVSAAEVDRWHRARGFRKIGYHRLVHLDGMVSVGRQDSEVGAHVRGWNAHSLGVCYVGGVDHAGRPKDTRTDAQKQALEDVIREWLNTYPGIKRIAGHSEFAAKACPSFDVKAEYVRFLKRAPEQEPDETTPDLILSKGDYGPLVREWQGHLRTFAYPDIDVDGDFGPATRKATRAFQEVQGIVTDGLVGPQTRQEMTDALSALAATR
ncbi:MAG: peptidoglycan-binding domain-containing protein [Pseudomonadota bacterium]